MRLKHLFLIFLLISIFVQLYFRFNLSLNRYFDVDEFAHLHWAYSFTEGSMPYRDFFYIFPPYFLFIIGVILKASGRTAEALLASRFFIFAFQIAAVYVLILWGRKLRNITTALLSAVIFIFLPLPSDKLLEIRPDLPATVLAMAGLFIFVKASENRKQFLYFASGFLLSASLAIVPKTIFFLIPLLPVFIYKIRKQHFYFLAGILANLAAVLVFFALSGKFVQALYFTTKLAGDVTNVLSSKFYMRPDIFFYPNDTYYGMPGLSATLIVNLIIYLTGCVWAIKCFISSLSHEDYNKTLREFIFSAAFAVNLFAFVKVFPLKHLQYLIPVAPFIAFYFADFLLALAQRMGRKLSYVLIPVFVVYITYLGWRMYQYKQPWNNKATIANINNTLLKIPENEPVFDLTGETIFFKDGYYFCCLPYGQYEEALNFDYPALDADLKKRGTKYIHIGRTERLGVLPFLHEKYVRENFKESDIFGFMVRK